MSERMVRDTLGIDSILILKIKLHKIGGIATYSAQLSKSTERHLGKFSGIC
jgi:hypothetical protein